MVEGKDPSVRRLIVNGRQREVHAEDDTPLLYVLRNHLGLKGTRFGCGAGPVRSLFRACRRPPDLLL